MRLKSISLPLVALLLLSFSEHPVSGQGYGGNGRGGSGRPNRAGPSRGSDTRGMGMGGRGCEVNPGGSMEDVAGYDRSVDIRCRFENVEACTFEHDHLRPIMPTRNALRVPDIRCTGVAALRGEGCEGHSNAYTYDFGADYCGLRLERPSPEDTGVWYVAVTTGGEELGQQRRVEQIEVAVYTFNESSVEIFESNNNLPVYNIETTYNRYDDDWIEGKRDWERLSIRCVGQGGRPEPQLRWFLGEDRRTELRRDEIFSIMQSGGGTGGNLFSPTVTSKLDFQVNDKLMHFLSSQTNMDTNPRHGVVSFDLLCDADQGIMVGAGRFSRVEINVRKEYDSGKLSFVNWLWIIGGALLVIIIVAGGIIAILVVGKKRNEGGQTRGYHDVKYVPRSAAAGQQNQPSQQVEQRVEEGRQRSSGGASSHSSMTKPIIKQKSDSLTPPPGPLKRSMKPTSLSSSSSDLDNSPKQPNSSEPPPRPYKPKELSADPDRRSFMNDPRNQVLPTYTLTARASRHEQQMTVVQDNPRDEML